MLYFDAKDEVDYSKVVLVLIFFDFFFIFIFCFVVAIFELVHDVEAIHDI